MLDLIHFIKGQGMARDWQQLTDLTRGADIVVERVRLVDADAAIEGSFELPPLARLSAEDQVFIIAFVQGHGSIKDVEKVFGISYPTVKNRLNRICQQLEFVEVDATPSSAEVLEMLSSGEISPADAIERLSS